MRIVEFIVGGRPVAKGRIRFSSKTGHAYPPERTVAYEGRVAAAAQSAMNGRPPVEAPVAVRLAVRLPIPASWPQKKQFAAEIGLLLPKGRPDTDNFVKICDALNHIVWVDDSQIVDLIATKRYSVTPGLTITVDDLEELA